ncbi:HelD family protein [Rugosimonospora africana]|nr:ATP-binding domain-containing protein [Rugosimonospora africana]
MLYGRLDAMRGHARDLLTGALAQTGGTQQERSQRDSTIRMHTDRIAQLDAVDSGLCFGRLDLAPSTDSAQPEGSAPLSDSAQPEGSAPPSDSAQPEGAAPSGPAPSAPVTEATKERRYIGRIGIFDEDGDYEPLLVDWRAPAARPFYLATAAAPLGVQRRAHIRTAGRKVVGVDDEVLDLALAASADRHSRYAGLTGEATLLAALNATRTGRMRDIVETIQGEQDRIIRADLGGVLVVQGGPGTGKTAVALHRAAYLLYTYRRELSSRGVLVVGPNTTFLSYISQVLPSLAETGVLLRTPADLYPGVSARRPEPAEAAELKGRTVMVELLANAIRDRQRVPDEALEIVTDRGSLWQDTLRLDPATCAEARERTRRLGRPHNLARPIFDTEIIHALSLQVAERIGTDPYADDPLGGDDAPGDEQLLEEADLAEIRRELRADPAVATALDWLWPILTPQQLLTDLYASADRIATAAPMLTDAQRALLHRDRSADWTVADVPLLDEAVELLGEDDRDATTLAELRRRQQAAYAEGALEILHGSRPIDLEDEIDPEILTATDLLDAGLLGERHEEREYLTAAERAAADRTWAFGHIIVDEAQELSPMAWRLLMRRCPSRSMTLVGDVAQTGDLSGTTSWARVLEPYVGDRWRLAELAVNYRTPAEIMALAGRVLANIDPALPLPRSVRETGIAPELIRVDPAELADRVVETVRREAAGDSGKQDSGRQDSGRREGGGRLGVLVPDGDLAELAATVVDAVPEAAVGDEADLESRVVVLTVRQAKGLEFDSVVVVDPAGIVAGSERGRSDLYVALTRPTQRLTVLCPGDLPAILEAPVAA